MPHFKKYEMTCCEKHALAQNRVTKMEIKNKGEV